jgi:hypothetical protein
MLLPACGLWVMPQSKGTHTSGVVWRRQGATQQSAAISSTRNRVRLNQPRLACSWTSVYSGSMLPASGGWPLRCRRAVASAPGGWPPAGSGARRSSAACARRDACASPPGAESGAHAAGSEISGSASVPCTPPAYTPPDDRSGVLRCCLNGCMPFRVGLLRFRASGPLRDAASRTRVGAAHRLWGTGRRPAPGRWPGCPSRARSRAFPRRGASGTCRPCRHRHPISLRAPNARARALSPGSCLDPVAGCEVLAPAAIRAPVVARRAEICPGHSLRRARWPLFTQHAHTAARVGIAELVTELCDAFPKGPCVAAPAGGDRPHSPQHRRGGTARDATVLCYALTATDCRPSPAAPHLADALDARHQARQRRLDLAHRLQLLARDLRAAAPPRVGAGALPVFR